MPTFEFREWLVGLIFGVAVCFALTPVRRPRRALDPATGLVLRCGPAFQRDGTHHRNDSGPHDGVDDVFTSGTGILFLAISLHRINMADAASAENRGFRVELPASAFSPRLVRAYTANRPGFRTPPTGSREPEAGCPTLLSSLAERFRMMQDFEDDEIPILTGRGEGFMEEVPATGSGHARRNEDIALDLMKFIAMTTGYGRTTSSGVGFQGTGAAAKPEDYAARLLELYGKCLSAVGAKK